MYYRRNIFLPIQTMRIPKQGIVIIVAVIAGFIPGIILTNIILVPVICSIEQSEGRISKIGYEMRIQGAI